MKKKILLLGSLILFVTSNIIIGMYLRKTNIFLVIVDIMILLFITGFLSERKLLKLRIPNLMNSKRNYDKILVCDEYFVDENMCLENMLILSNYGRNLRTDILIVQRFYSFLHTNGECILIFDFNNGNYFNKKSINTLDYNFLHVVTLLENNINTKGISFLLTKFFNKYKFLIYKIGLGRVKKNSKYDIKDIKKILSNLSLFSIERNFKIKILMKNCKEFNLFEMEYPNIKFEKLK